MDPCIHGSAAEATARAAAGAAAVAAASAAAALRTLSCLLHDVHIGGCEATQL